MNWPIRGSDGGPSGGFTLLELLIGLTVGSMALAGVSLVSIALQRSFQAADYRMGAQNDQLRLLDYLSRDLRMASTITLLNNNAKVTLTLPPDNPGLLNLSLGPVMSSLRGSGAGATTGRTVSYYVEGGQFIREVDGGQSVLADTVAGLDFQPGNHCLITGIVFTPQFSFSPTLATQENTRVNNCVYLRNTPMVQGSSTP